MLYLDPNSPNISVAKQTHYTYTLCFVNKKIGGPKCSSITCIICTSKRKVVTSLIPAIKTFLTSGVNLKTILIGSPSELELVNIAFWNIAFPGTPLSNLLPYFTKKKPDTLSKKPLAWQTFYKSVHGYINQIEAIFSYSWLTTNDGKPYNAYDLSKQLDRYTCTYCNRTYTSTIIRQTDKLPITRPTLDHWFPKSTYPLLAISFYNLVPSCNSCNSSVKGTIAFSLANHVHPYVDAQQTTDFKFDYAYTALNGYRISILDSPNGLINGSKASKTMKNMSLDEVYNSHISELRDLLIIKKNYSVGYIKIMKSLLKINMSTSEVYRILFGVIYDHQNYHKRPLSKFKNDILKKLNMLDDM